MHTKILDEPFRKEDLPPDFIINRYAFSFEGNELYVKQGRTKNSKAIVGAIVSVLFGFSFMFMVSAGLRLGMHMYGIAFFTFFTFFSFGYGIHLIIKGYYSKKVFEFDKGHLKITKLIGSEKVFPKVGYESVFVRDFTLNSLKSIEVCILQKVGSDFSLMKVDLPNAPWFSGKKERENIEKAKAEAIQIGQTISDYWEIPFGV
ncbi:MAG: hypothetical protein ACJA0U_002598 [Salibacteraceae bacterium]|jgi:hypothetical protein